MADEPKSNGGIDSNILALLGYLLLIPAILAVAVDPFKKDPFARFHGYQALFLCAAFFIINMAVGMMVHILVMLAPVYMLVFPAEGILSIVCCIKAFQKEEFKLPIIGELAAQQAAKG